MDPEQQAVFKLTNVVASFSCGIIAQLNVLLKIQFLWCALWGHPSTLGFMKLQSMPTDKIILRKKMLQIALEQSWKNFGLNGIDGTRYSDIDLDLSFL